MLILGLETTCDETAAAVVEDGTCVCSSIVRTQIDLHQKFGGVVPEIASRAHLESLDFIIAEALSAANITGTQLDAIAVAHAPGLIGCLLVGLSAAKALTFAWQKPLIPINHVQAHLYSVLLQGPLPNSQTPKLPNSPHPTLNPSPFTLNPPLPAIGLVISGGHSALYHIRSWTDITRIGTTHDDAVGEAFDKVAAILQLGYPGGPLIDALAKEGDENAIQFPISLLEKNSLDFSFSGIKTAVLYHVNGKQGRERDASCLTPQQKADVAAGFQRAAAEMLIQKLRRAAAQYETHAFLIGGGVSANSFIRNRLYDLSMETNLPVLIPQKQFCTDNAAMIAGLAHPLFLGGKTADLSLEAIATV